MVKPDDETVVFVTTRDYYGHAQFSSNVGTFVEAAATVPPDVVALSAASGRESGTVLAVYRLVHVGDFIVSTKLKPL